MMDSIQFATANNEINVFIERLKKAYTDGVAMSGAGFNVTYNINENVCILIISFKKTVIHGDE